jgi:hypothetical protein
MIAQGLGNVGNGIIGGFEKAAGCADAFPLNP